MAIKLNDSTSILSDLNVLVVDDQETMRKIIRQLLKQAQIGNSFEAANGEEALKFIENIHEPNPDVVICDLHMDGMDGMEFCNTLRRSKKLEIPVIILTGDSDRLLHETTLQVGAVAIMTKPVSAGDLLQKIEEVVGFSVN